MSWLLWVVLAAAPAGDGDVVALTPQAAVERAKAHNVDHKALASRVHEEQVKADRWLQLENPELRMGDFRSDRLLNPLFDGSGWDHPLEDTRFGLRWKPPQLSELGPEQQAQSHRAQRFQQEFLDEEKQLERRVLVLHAELRNLKRRLDLAEEAVQLAQRVQGMMQQRMRARVATKLDEAISKLDVLDEVADREDLQSRYRTQLTTLRSLLALPADAYVELLPPPAPVCGEVATDDAQMEALVDVHPRVTAVDASLREVESELFATHLAFAPWFDFLQVAAVPGGEDDPVSLRFRLSITLPVFDQQRDEAAILHAHRARLRAVRQATRHDLQTRLVKAQEELASQVALMRLYQESAVDVLQTSAATLDKALAERNADLLEVASVKNRVLRARRGELRALLACERAAIDVWTLANTWTSSPLQLPWERVMPTPVETPEAPKPTPSVVPETPASSDDAAVR